MTGLGARVGRQLVTVDGVVHPVLGLSRGEFDRLPEYSMSLPTGVVIGKRWKRKLFPQQVVEVPGSSVPEWRIGEYTRESVTYPGDVDITWYMPRIVESGQVGG